MHRFIYILTFTSSLTVSFFYGAELLSKTQKNFFYHGQDYGSESQFNGLNPFFNVGLLLASRYNYSESLSDIAYKKGLLSVRDSVFNPVKTIEDAGGFSHFFSREIFPLGPEAGTGAWVPNYTLHFLGEGMLYRKLTEYYTSQGSKYPLLWATISLGSAQLMNEILESGLKRHTSTDPLADMIFNIAGMIAFSYDSFAQLFSSDFIVMNYWPGQPVIDVQDTVLFNQAEQYVWKISWNLLAPWKVFWATGLPSGLGISIPSSGGNNFSYALGFDAVQLRPPGALDPIVKKEQKCIESATRKDAHKLCREQAELDAKEKGKRLTSISPKDLSFAFGFYWDRNESLMLSAFLELSNEFAFNVNLYPGWLKINDLAIGAYIYYSEYRAKALGLTFQYLPVVPGARF